MGLAGLTAVFGMGTGVTPPVWSPEMYPAGGQAGRARGFPRLVAHRSHKPFDANEWVLLHDSAVKKALRRWHADRCAELLPLGFLGTRGWQRPDRGGQAAWLLGPVG